VFESVLAQQVPVERLDESFRLHRTQAAFLADHIYVHDGFTFHSRQTRLLATLPPGADAYVAAVLDPTYPTVVIEHTEERSQQANPLEQALIAPLIRACCDGLGLDPAKGIGVVVPHRAQKAALRRQFPALAAANAIDTVERFQGGEREVIIVSATASDPQYVLTEAAFLLNLNRLNVALSRPRCKLIVVAARSIFRLLTDDLTLFEQAVLWKRLRYSYATTPLWQGTRAGYSLQAWGHPCGHPLLTPAPPALAPLPVTLSLRKQRSKEAW
jgi:superfamily I DNA and/or RNA helicase